jgi:hypothetical protein
LINAKQILLVWLVHLSLINNNLSINLNGLDYQPLITSTTILEPDVINCNSITSHTIRVNNASIDYPLSIAYLSEDIFTINNDGLVNCKALRTNSNWWCWSVWWY